MLVGGCSSSNLELLTSYYRSNLTEFLLNVKDILEHLKGLVDQRRAV